ncbi:MAG: 16S rRNA (uracil(1498)-N(3))-methyltransferase [Prevotella sp.]|nr:16S rRNA (uracil(1498)-N(3))-methyltransferase [Prevotella sp.]
MKEAHYFYVPDAEQLSELPADEAAHAVRVLRLQFGDELFLMDGKGTFFRAEVTLASGKHCTYNIVERMEQQPTWQGHLHLAMAPTKMMDRVEWMAEKATEIGFDELSFLNCQFSERRQLRVDRVEKIVVSAMKQSRKAWKPVVNDMVAFKDFVTTPRQGRKFIAHCYEEIVKKDLFDELQACVKNNNDVNDKYQPLTVLIGPEGDFSIDEVRLAMENGYESITLGQSRLRTETAALAAVMMMQLSMRKE